MEIDYERCMALVKTQNRQCVNRQKIGSDLCGIHIKVKNLVRVDDDLEKSLVNKTKDLILDDDKTHHKPKKSAFSQFERIEPSKIIKIQTLARRRIALKRYRSRVFPECPVNLTDFLYDTHFLEMSECLYFDFFDKDKKRYFFDIRSLKKHIETSGMTNPYTRNEIPVESQDIFRKKLAELENKGVKTEIEKAKFSSKEKEIEMKVLEVFQKINALDNYVNHEWFLNMNIKQLHHLYKVMEDTFNYRCQMPLSKKKDLVKDGKAFPIHPNDVKFVESKTKMMELCITEFDRFATEGKTKDDCKLGTMLMLTAFVEVCPKAAAAQEMSLYVQNMADGLY